MNQERAFYQRQAARGKLSEKEFDARMDKTEVNSDHWQSEIERPTELRDSTVKVQDALEHATEILNEFSDIDQDLDELDAMPEDQRNEVLKIRQKIIRTLCDKATIGSDGRIKLTGVIDGSTQFDSVDSRVGLRPS